MDFDTAGGSITAIENAIREIEKVKQYLNSKTLIVNDGDNCMDKMMDEVENIAEEMANVRQSILSSASTMKRSYNSFRSNSGS